MAGKIDTGGQVAPMTRGTYKILCECCSKEQGQDGMTLLDYAAVEIAAQLVASTRPIDAKGHAIADVIARGAYDMAAALVAEKRRREGGE